jgi:hypothetical protein
MKIDLNDMAAHLEFKSIFDKIPHEYWTATDFQQMSYDETLYEGVSKSFRTESITK